MMLNIWGECGFVVVIYKCDVLVVICVYFDVEMEIGIGKIYCYIKIIFELNKCYGWLKFIIMVLLIVICEGVYKLL